MPRLISMIGLARSGKSTVVNEYYLNNCFNICIVCQDDIRKAFGHDFNIRTEPMVKAFALTMTRALMERSVNVIIDETNTSRNNLKSYIDLANEYEYPKECLILKTNERECYEVNRFTKQDPRLYDAISRMNKNLISLLSDDFLLRNFYLVQTFSKVTGWEEIKDYKDLNNLKKFFEDGGVY